MTTSTQPIPTGNYLHYILDQLSGMDGFTFRKMLGGIGFYRDGHLFGAIAGGKFRLRAPAECGEKCEREPLYFSEVLVNQGPYCTVPEPVVMDKQLLQTWAERAYELTLSQDGGWSASEMK